MMRSTQVTVEEGTYHTVSVFWQPAPEDSGYIVDKTGMKIKLQLVLSWDEMKQLLVDLVMSQTTLHFILL